MMQRKLQYIIILLLVFSAYPIALKAQQKPCNQVIRDTLWLCHGTKILNKGQPAIIVNDTFITFPSAAAYVIDVDPYNTTSNFYDSLKISASANVFTRTIYGILFPQNDSLKNGLQTALSTTKADLEYQKFKGKTIRKIYIHQLKVFGPTISNPEAPTESGLGKWGNSLHVNTRKEVILKNLFFAEGQKIDPYLLAENAQILRNLAYFAELKIVVVPVENNSNLVDVVIISQDAFSYGLELGVINASVWDFSVFNNNFLGRGNKINATFRTNLEQSPFLLVNNLNYTIDNINGTFFNASVDYTHTNYIQTVGLNIKRDFYSIGSRYAGGLSFFNTEETKGIYYPQYTSDIVKYNMQNLWIGKAFKLLPGAAFRQLVVSGSLNNKQFTQRPYTNENTNKIYYNSSIKLISFTVFNNGYYTSNYIYKFGTTEDIPFGSFAELTVGPESFEYYNRIYYSLRFGYARYFDKFGYLSGNFLASGFSHNDNFEQAQIGLRADYFSDIYQQGIYKIRYFLTGNYRLGINRLAGESLNAVEELSIIGLSTADTIYFAGTKKLTLNYTAIVNTPIYYYGFKLAFINFVNIALIGAADKFALNNKFYSGFGVGVLLRNENLIIKTLQFRLGYYPGIPGDRAGLQFEIKGINLLDFIDFKPKQPKVIKYR